MTRTDVLFREPVGVTGISEGPVTFDPARLTGKHQLGSTLTAVCGVEVHLLTRVVSDLDTFDGSHKPLYPPVISLVCCSGNRLLIH